MRRLLVPARREDREVRLLYHAHHHVRPNGGAQLMSKHVTISPSEAADRLAIRELVEAYAYCADRRDAKGQMSLFTEDTHFVGLYECEGSGALTRAALAR